MYYPDEGPELTAEDLMLAYDTAGAESDWAELLVREAWQRACYYQAQGMDEAAALERSGYELAKLRARKARREVDVWWEQIRPRVMISDGGRL
jgi:hypothetical protein